MSAALKRFERLGVAAQLQTRFVQALAAKGHSDVQVLVNVDEFRLRTKKQVAWTGMMSGGDFVGAQVELRRGGQTLKSFKVTGVSVKGGTFGSDETKRLNRILDAATEKFSSELEG